MSKLSSHRSDSIQPRFLAIDFFCGAGGTTRGLIDAGGYVIAGVDKDKKCADTYTLNNPNENLDGHRPRFLDYDIFPATNDYPAGQQAELVSELDELIAEYRTLGSESAAAFCNLRSMPAVHHAFKENAQREQEVGKGSRQQPVTRSGSICGQVPAGTSSVGECGRNQRRAIRRRLG